MAKILRTTWEDVLRAVMAGKFPLQFRDAHGKLVVAGKDGKVWNMVEFLKTEQKIRSFLDKQTIATKGIQVLPG